MTKQRNSSFTMTVFASTQRLFRSNRNRGLLASHQINKRTMKDIGINPTDLL